MPNKIEMARMIAEQYPGLSPWVGTALWWLLVALGTYRLTSVIRHGAKWLDIFFVPIGLALIGDLMLQRWLYDSVTWMGAGLGLIAGATIVKHSPWIAT